VAQINMLVNTLLASFLVTGSVSWLYYSDRLMEFPLGVFGIALATVILPSLARRHARNSHDEFSHLLDWGLRWVFLIAVPASVALVILSAPLLTTFFHFGAFGANDVRMSANALMAFSFGLLGFILIKVLADWRWLSHSRHLPMLGCCSSCCDGTTCTARCPAGESSWHGLFLPAPSWARFSTGAVAILIPG
jgi:putative peptidoglycan lipid II flippase